MAESDDVSPAALPVRLSRDDRKRQTHDQLLGSALRVFRRLGYQKATLDTIAAEAGLTKGAVYWHFPNKQALFLSVLADALKANISALTTLLDLAGDPVRLKQSLATWIDDLDEREVLPMLGLELEIEARRDPSFRALHQAMVVRHEQAMAGFLDQYFTATGDDPPMPIPDLASTLITIFKGFALSRQNRPGPPVNSAQVMRLLLRMPPPER